MEIGKMTTPRKAEIIERATELFHNDQWQKGIRNAVNPEYSELLESGYIAQAQSELMRNLETEHSEYLHNLDTMQNMIRDKHETPIDLKECKRSNILISGTNQQGKSLCAMSISDILMANQWQIVAFDSVGIWKHKSSIPNYVSVKDKNQSVIFTKSTIYDLSLLKLKAQKRFIERFLEELWLLRVISKTDKWLLVIFEEFQMMAKNLRGELSQNILRIMSVGANHRIRSLGITPDLSLIDCAFIRLAQQRYHFKLGNEPNAKRRFRAYYGFDYTRISQDLDVGFCLYVLKDKIAIYKIPMFQPRLKVKA